MPQTPNVLELVEQLAMFTVMHPMVPGFLKTFKETVEELSYLFLLEIWKNTCRVGNFGSNQVQRLFGYALPEGFPPSRS